jgi:predicted amidohydrolase
MTHFKRLSAALGFILAVAPALAAADPDDWDRGNLIANGAFNVGAAGGLPQGWTVVAPNPALSPRFERVSDSSGRQGLQATGNGRDECFGYVCHPVRFTNGSTYRFRVRLRTEGLDDLNRHLVHGVFGPFNDGIFVYHKAGPMVVGDARFPAPAGGDGEVRLYFRFSPKGRVRWEQVSIQECPPILPRLVKVACSWGGGDREHWERWLDAAGREWADVALLPEMFNGKGPKDAEPMTGPAARLLADKARQWRMYVSGSFYEKRGDLTFNTAPFYDRSGQLVGTYEKVQVYDPEEDDGVSPGRRFPVFDTDFGRVGILICYDSWFPEMTRLLAYRGAELVLLPNAGYFMGLMPARAADNGVGMVVSSLGNPAGVWDSGGAMAGEPEPEPTRSSPSTIRSYRKDDALRMITATLDLSRRSSPAWWGGPMRSAPGGRRVRQTLIAPIEDQIAIEARRWWTLPETRTGQPK